MADAGGLCDLPLGDGGAVVGTVVAEDAAAAAAVVLLAEDEDEGRAARGARVAQVVRLPRDGVDGQLEGVAVGEEGRGGVVCRHLAEGELHHDDVDVAVELEARAGEVGDDGEAELLVQPQRAEVVGLGEGAVADGGDDVLQVGVLVDAPGLQQQRLVQRGAHALRAQLGRDVHGDLCRDAPAGAPPELGEVRVAQHGEGAGAVVGDEVGQAQRLGDAEEAAGHLVQRGRLVLEGDVAALHVRRVDLQDRGQVLHRRGTRGVAGGRRRSGEWGGRRRGGSGRGVSAGLVQRLFGRGRAHGSSRDF